jgi:hypothetical protein
MRSEPAANIWLAVSLLSALATPWLARDHHNNFAWVSTGDILLPIFQGAAAIVALILLIVSLDKLIQEKSNKLYIIVLAVAAFYPGCMLLKGIGHPLF